MSEQEKEAVPYYAVGADGNPLLFGGYKVINPNFQQHINGLTPVTVDAPPADRFGESGEVFDHLLHRNIMSTLWNMPTSKASLTGQLNGLHLRGKSIKLQFKGRSLNVTIHLPDTGKEGRSIELNKVLGTGSKYSMIVHFPRETTNVPAWAMTPERFKCVTRPMVVSMILDDWRFPATTEAIGYADLVRDYHKTSLLADEEFGKTEWGTIFKRLGTSAASLLALTSMIAGCISSKEIYQIDEDMFGGCTWWSGVHAMMTDAHNRLIANAQTVDKRARLENSSFYSDFKRKMAARGMVTINTQEYIDFLNALEPMMKQHVKSNSLMTEKESTLLDSIVRGATDKARTVYKEKIEKPVEGQINANSSEALKLLLHNYADNLTIKDSSVKPEEGAVGGEMSKYRPK